MQKCPFSSLPSFPYLNTINRTELGRVKNVHDILVIQSMLRWCKESLTVGAVSFNQ